MKQYQVISVNENPEVMDLVNINDSSDRIMCAPDEFKLDEIINEEDFYIERCNYVDDHNFNSGDFAFRKIN